MKTVLYKCGIIIIIIIINNNNDNNNNSNNNNKNNNNTNNDNNDNNIIKTRIIPITVSIRPGKVEAPLPEGGVEGVGVGDGD